MKFFKILFCLLVSFQRTLTSPLYELGCNILVDNTVITNSSPIDGNST